MLDFKNIEKYKENNRIEAKKALGGLPESLWETYSAFANTFGGIILLGVEELPDKSFKTVNLPDPEGLIKKFWRIIKNKQKVSINILHDNDVRIINVGGNRIVAIEVPRANRHDKPVYIDGNPFIGSYRRNGEGDYHCTEAEVQNMLRDSSDLSQDLLVLEKMDLSVFHKKSIDIYRTRFEHVNPGHVWNSLSEKEFLQSIGAIGIDSTDKKLHPTIAGLLMFGYEKDIVKEFSNYFLEYREKSDTKSTGEGSRVVSNSGDWSGNLFDFYFRIYSRIAKDIKAPFYNEKNVSRNDDTPVHIALREALANALIHANYYDSHGLIIEKKKESLVITNPGGLRISIAEAVNGGTSDPRNATLLKMFSLVGIGKQEGRGIPGIHEVWKKQNWETPILKEVFNPDRTILSLKLKKISGRKSAIKNENIISTLKVSEYEQKIIEYLTMNIVGKTSDFSELLCLKDSSTRNYLSKLMAEGIIVAEGNNRNRRYKLKS